MDNDVYYSVFAGEKRESAQFPEKHLLSAVLKRALIDLFGKDRGAALDAEKWFFNGLPRTTEFSFSWVCEQLSLDQRILLERIRLLKQQATRASSAASMGSSFSFLSA